MYLQIVSQEFKPYNEIQNRNENTSEKTKLKKKKENRGEKNTWQLNWAAAQPYLPPTRHRNPPEEPNYPTYLFTH